jgi:putative tricarboxylic transport membrane protein
MSDRIVGLVLVLLASGYGWIAGDYDTGFSDPVGPAVFPRLLAVVIGLLGLWLILRPDPEPDWTKGRTLALQSLAVALMLGYALFLVPVGFLIATTILAAALAAMLGARPLQAVASGALVSVGVYFLFTQGLELSLPAGKLISGG